MAATWNSGEIPGSTNFWYPTYTKQQKERHIRLGKVQGGLETVLVHENLLQYIIIQMMKVRQQKQYKYKREMGSSDHWPINFLQLWVLNQQKRETQDDALLMEHIFSCYPSPTIVHLTAACGQQCITCSPPLARTCTLPDSYLDKEEVSCRRGIQVAIRREQYSGKTAGIKAQYLLWCSFEYTYIIYTAILLYFFK